MKTCMVLGCSNPLDVNSGWGCSEHKKQQIVHCDICKGYTVFDTVDTEPKGYPETSGGCRDMKTDYRTVKCSRCGNQRTFDFATD